MMCLKPSFSASCQSNVRNKGDVNVSGRVWVCVVCDIVKRVWERLVTRHHSWIFLFFFFWFGNRTPDHSRTSATHGATCSLQVLFAKGQSVRQQFLTFLLARIHCCWTVFFLFLFFSFFLLSHGSSDLSVRTARQVCRFGRWVTGHSWLRANHNLQLTISFHT